MANLKLRIFHGERGSKFSRKLIDAVVYDFTVDKLIPDNRMSCLEDYF